MIGSFETVDGSRKPATITDGSRRRTTTLWRADFREETRLGYRGFDRPLRSIMDQNDFEDTDAGKPIRPRRGRVL
jgi:hypothetical protein